MSVEQDTAVRDGVSTPDSNTSPKLSNEKHIAEGSDDANPDELAMSQKEYRHIIHKLDWAIIPYCTLLCVSYSYFLTQPRSTG
jgi:hypothetical protein